MGADAGGSVAGELVVRKAILTITLHLGVIDVPYSADRATQAKRVKSLDTKAGRDKAMRSGAPSNHQTTGGVAEILENRYHVMEVFAEETGLDLIAKSVERAIDNSIRDLFSGSPVHGTGASPAADAFAEIEEAFRIFIDQKEMDGLQPGVPTAAALAGVNHRLLHPYAKGNPPRPSFRDTGAYQASMKAWAGDIS